LAPFRMNYHLHEQSPSSKLAGRLPVAELTIFLRDHIHEVILSRSERYPQRESDGWMVRKSCR
jgi:hypothetical protein